MNTPAMALLPAILLLCAASAAATEPVPTSRPDFESLKRLAGEWQLEDASGKVSGTVVYKVTSAGSAVVETAFPGTQQEMVTVYTREGDRVAVTHYCAAGNQPHMVSKAGAASNQLKFDFVGAGNMKSPNEMHMRNLTVTFLDADHIRQQWQTYADGKLSEHAEFDLKRRS